MRVKSPYTHSHTHTDTQPQEEGVLVRSVCPTTSTVLPQMFLEKRALSLLCHWDPWNSYPPSAHGIYANNWKFLWWVSGTKRNALYFAHYCDQNKTKIYTAKQIKIQF